MAHRRGAGRRGAAGGGDERELLVHLGGGEACLCGAVRRAGAGTQRLVLAGAAAGRSAGQGIRQPPYPHGAEAGRPLRRPSGFHPARLVQLRPPDHHRQRGQCGLHGHGARLRGLPLPGQRRLQSRADALADAGDDAGHPVRGRQHRPAPAKSPAGEARKAHRLVLLLLPVHLAGQRRSGAFCRPGGAGRHDSGGLHRHGGRHRPCRGNRPRQRAGRPLGQRVACLHPGGLQRLRRCPRSDLYGGRRDGDEEHHRHPEGFRHRRSGSRAGGLRGGQRRVPQHRLASLRAARPRKAVERRLRLPGGELHSWISGR